ncbi:MAG: LysM peptidoglycan-binding domain-containing protein [Methylotenera sp.]|nr:LysM peptidoglycan-binding domain-containing protein [Oligoflexia bacterium]
METKLLKRLSTLGLALAFSTAMTACSLTQTSSTEDAISDELPVATAETDAVPMEKVEDPKGQPGGKDSLEAISEQPAAPIADAPPAPPAADPAALPLADPATSTPPMSLAEATPPPPAAQPDPIAAPAAPEPVAQAPVPAEHSAPAPSSGTGEHQEYTVQKGDTLMKIAFEVYGDIYQWKKILEDNSDKISSANAIPKGTVLKVDKSVAGIDRNGEKYLIKNGDTLGTISDDVYGTKAKWKKLWENNKQLIKDPNRIFAGFYLYYTMSAEDQQELDQKKGATQAAPLAEDSAAAPRTPANAK